MGITGQAHGLLCKAKTREREKNAMGKVKLFFQPVQHYVQIHPQNLLEQQKELSHGCIRLKQDIWNGEILLRN